MEQMIAKAKDEIQNLPEKVSLAGFAISRLAYMDGSEEPIKPTVEDVITYYNWGCYCSGTVRLSFDLLVSLKLSVESAGFLAPTLAKYVFEELPDNFKVNIKLKSLFVDAFNDAVTKTCNYVEHTEHVETAEYIIIDKNAAVQPIPDSPIIHAPAGTHIIQDEIGWRRVYIDPDKNNGRTGDLGKMIEELRSNSTPDKEDDKN